MKTFTFHIDPGHGWLKVSVADCLDVQLMPSDFSKYSYRRGDELYLEEDCDASKFFKAFIAKHGAMPVIRDSHSNSDSFIRRLPRVGGNTHV